MTDDVRSHPEPTSGGFHPDQEMLYHYIQRKLSPAEEEKVELWLMDNPGAVADLELDLGLKEGLKEIRPKAPVRIPRRQSYGWFSRPVFAAAALVLLSGNIVLSIALLNRDGPPATGSALVVDLVQFRGAQEPFIVSISGQTDLILRMFPTTADQGPYTIELRPPGPHSPIEIEDLRPDQEGVVAARVNTAALIPGMWTVTLSRREKRISDFQLRVDE